MKKFLTIFFYFIISFSLQGKEEEKDDKTFVVSHAPHPSINVINNLINIVYQSLGYKVEFTSVPSHRGVTLLNDGVVDADSIRMKGRIMQYENIVLIEPELLNIEIFLICQKGIPCSREILKDESVNILSVRGNVLTLGEENIAANIILNEKSGLFLDLMRAERYKYVLFTITPSLLKKVKEEFNLVSIASPHYHHVIHKKYSDLIPQIEKKLKEVLNNSEFSSINATSSP